MTNKARPTEAQMRLERNFDGELAKARGASAPQEPVVDDGELIDEFLREIYGHAFREGAESTIEQWDAEISSGGPRPETPSMPHNDYESEGSYQFSEDVKPKLLALLNRLQAKAPETGEG